jgi:hypothetical protein
MADAQRASGMRIAAANECETSGAADPSRTWISRAVGRLEDGVAGWKPRCTTSSLASRNRTASVDLETRGCRCRWAMSETARRWRSYPAPSLACDSGLSGSSFLRVINLSSTSSASPGARGRATPRGPRAAGQWRAVGGCAPRTARLRQSEHGRLIGAFEM